MVYCWFIALPLIDFWWLWPALQCRLSYGCGSFRVCGHGGGIWGGSDSCGIGHHGGILIFRGLVTSIGGVFVLGWGLGGRL